MATTNKKKPIKKAVKKEPVKRVKKVSAKKTEEAPFKPQDEAYWATRPEEDPHKDWGEGEGTWIDQYRESVDHPHRQLIIEVLRALDFSSLFEAGCNAGPNLARITDVFPEARLVGCDVNEKTIERARLWSRPEIDFYVGGVSRLPFDTQSFDVGLTDAVLIYSDPREIGQALDELVRVARKALILVEWYDESLLGIIKDYHWCRDYKTLLENRGYKVSVQKITKKDWPSANWTKNGRVFVATKES